MIAEDLTVDIVDINQFIEAIVDILDIKQYREVIVDTNVLSYVEILLICYISINVMLYNRKVIVDTKISIDTVKLLYDGNQYNACNTHGMIMIGTMQYQYLQYSCLQYLLYDRDCCNTI